MTINNSVNPAAQTCHLLVLKCDFNQVSQQSKENLSVWSDLIIT